MSLIDDAVFCLKPRCPVCREGRLFKPWTIEFMDRCEKCGENLSDNDVADGATVFLIFILGFTIIPAAWMLQLAIAPPLWVHAILWTIVSLGIVAVLMPAIKAYILLLEYRHRRKS